MLILAVKEIVMTVERYLRLIAGALILASVAIGYWVSPWFFLFTAFVGINLFQSGFTNWCPMMAILRNAGVERPSCCATTKQAAPRAA
jgi:hypothetical protein